MQARVKCGDCIKSRFRAFYGKNPACFEIKNWFEYLTQVAIKSL
jgi:hypothetical protein